MTNFKGVGVALVTPFLDNGAIDYKSLSQLVNHTIVGGVDFLVALGTTGEPATLSDTEKKHVVDHILEINNNRLSVVLGIGGNNTSSVIDQIGAAEMEGISGILSVVPYYNKPTQEGIFQHFDSIAQSTSLPIILYNVPGRTGVNMSAETTLRLAHAHKNIVGIKDASGNLNQAAYILRDRVEGFSFLSGDDNSTLALIALGGDGVISVSANCFTETFTKMVHCALRGDFVTAQTENLKLHQATDLLFVEGNPAGAKAALEIKGIIKNNLRLPLIKASEQLYEKLNVQIKKYNL